MSNLAAILGDSPALAGRLFITQLAGTLNRPEGSRRRPPAGALPPRNFRLDPRAAQRVLATARHLRLVAFGAAFRRAAQVTATSPVFTSFAPALVTVSATGRIAERRAGGDVLLSGDSDDLAFTRWLQARLRPVRWAAHRPRAGSYSSRAGSPSVPSWNQTVVPAPS